jgi:hypothetical protein
MNLTGLPCIVAFSQTFGKYFLKFRISDSVRDQRGSASLLLSAETDEGSAPWGATYARGDN